IITFSMEHKTLINAQSCSRENTAMSRSDEFVYIFLTDADCHDLSQREFRDIVEYCFGFLWKISYTMDKYGNKEYNVRNVEIDLDIITETYTVRFTTVDELTEFVYAIQVCDYDDNSNTYAFRIINL
ncbi:MAG: hypothetical protein ACI4J7_11765, partial [Ruminiclostridium sp.]